MELIQKTDLRDPLAAERPFLSWIRTGFGADGIWLRCSPLWPLSAAVGTDSARALSVDLWSVTLVWYSVDSNGGPGLCSLSMASYSPCRRVKSRKRSAFPSIHTSCGSNAVPGHSRIGDGNLLGFRAGLPNVHVQDKQEVSMTSTVAVAGIVDKPSNHSVEETVDRLKNILQSKGVTLFALVDHSGEAEKAGMRMPPTKLLILGNPKAGTPLMLAVPSIAIDLPLKILVWEDAHKKTWVSYNSSTYLQERHNLPTELLQNTAVVETLAAKAAE